MNSKASEERDEKNLGFQGLSRLLQQNIPNADTSRFQTSSKSGQVTARSIPCLHLMSQLHGTLIN